MQPSHVCIENHNVQCNGNVYIDAALSISLQVVAVYIDLTS